MLFIDVEGLHVLEQAEVVGHGAVAFQREEVAGVGSELSGVVDAGEGAFVVTGHVDHAGGIDGCGDGGLKLGGLIEQMLVDGHHRIGGGFVENVEPRQVVQHGQHLIGAGEGLGGVEQIAGVVGEVDFRDDGQNVVSSEEQAGDGERAVVGGAQHDEAAPFIPAIFVANDVGAGDEAAHGVADQVDGLVGAEPGVDAGVQLVGGQADIAAPVEVERPDGPLLAEAGELAAIEAHVHAGSADVDLTGAFGIQGELTELALNEAENLHPQETLAVAFDGV